MSLKAKIIKSTHKEFHVDRLRDIETCDSWWQQWLPFYMNPDTGQVFVMVIIEIGGTGWGFPSLGGRISHARAGIYVRERRGYMLFRWFLRYSQRRVLEPEAARASRWEREATTNNNNAKRREKERKRRKKTSKKRESPTRVIFRVAGPRGRDSDKMPVLLYNRSISSSSAKRSTY